MNILTIDTVAGLIARHGLETCLHELIHDLRRDFSRWHEFTMIPRPAMHVPGGVLELMPICDQTYYTFKYVNCHPRNPGQGLNTVVATGQLVRVDTGYPLMYTEMVLLTALRTAATAALATDLMARADARIMAVVGTGAQSEFQVRATELVRGLTEVRFFDIDRAAMDKFERNMADSGMKLVRCRSAREAVTGADIITVCTACKAHVDVVKKAWVKAGAHINALGGDCPGKTELERTLLPGARVVVEYFEQSYVEGEIQQFTLEEAKKIVAAELHQLVTGHASGRDR
ncbi:MAG TPA: ornithine cyclodeaminase, partial [Candidatus Saccharimonadia bacterium]|nr:ornithine cyclodeaminase [Candidatus Saccharimonadia bacterium]